MQRTYATRVDQRMLKSSPSGCRSVGSRNVRFGKGSDGSVEFASAGGSKIKRLVLDSEIRSDMELRFTERVLTLKSMCAAGNLDQLPLELLTVIFRQLPLDDRKNVRLVCRRFHDVCTRWYFIRNEKFVFRRGCVDSSSIVKLLLGCNYSAFNLEFVRIPMNELPISMFPSSDSQKIRHLTLNECSFSLKTITEIITYCCDLQCLKIVFNDDTKALRKTLNLLKLGTIFADLIKQKVCRTSLTEFELIIHQHLKDKRFPWNALIANILTVFPNIKSLVCLGSCVSYTFKPNTELEKLLRRSKLEVLRFNVAVENSWFEKITRFPNLRLRKISVVQTCGENLISWLHCFQNQSELTELNLTLWHYVSQAHLESFFIGAVKHCDNLRRLRVQEWLCTDISMEFTPEILNLLLNSRLELVDLPFDDKALTKGSIERPLKPWTTNTTLQTLILRGCSEESSYAPIFEYFTNLRHLEVTVVDDVTLQKIFKYEVNLRCLIIGHHLLCSDFGFTGKDSDTNGQMKEEPFSIARLKNLEYLDISRMLDENSPCSTLSEAILHEFDLPKLKVLSINVDIHVTKESLVALARKVPSLEYFHGYFHNTPKNFTGEFRKHTRKLRTFSYQGLISKNSEFRLNDADQMRTLRFIAWQANFYYFNPFSKKLQTIVEKCWPDETDQCVCGSRSQ